MGINFLVGPLVGAVIGYITNKIAIKMLFRPLNPIKIGKFTLPFTPGVIPKEKSRIAKTIGIVVSRELLDEETFKGALMKPQMTEAIRDKVYDSINEFKEDDRTFIEVSEQIFGKNKSDFLIKNGEANITYAIYSRVVDMELGKLIMQKVVAALKGGAVSQFLGPMSFLLKDNMIDGIGEKIEPVISQMIVNESEEIIKKAVEDESVKLQFKTIGECSEKVEEHKDDIAEAVIYIYEQLAQKHLSSILKNLNISEMIENKIMEFDTLQMEKIILEIMDRELRRLVWLGALLGGIMGIVMSLF